MQIHISLFSKLFAVNNSHVTCPSTRPHLAITKLSLLLTRRPLLFGFPSVGFLSFLFPVSFIIRCQVQTRAFHSLPCRTAKRDESSWLWLRHLVFTRKIFIPSRYYLLTHTHTPLHAYEPTLRTPNHPHTCIIAFAHNPLLINPAVHWQTRTLLEIAFKLVSIVIRILILPLLSIFSSFPSLFLPPSLGLNILNPHQQGEWEKIHAHIPRYDVRPPYCSIVIPFLSSLAPKRMKLTRFWA